MYLISIMYEDADAWAMAGVARSQAEAVAAILHDLARQPGEHRTEWVRYDECTAHTDEADDPCPGFETCGEDEYGFLYVDGDAWYRVEWVSAVWEADCQRYGLFGIPPKWEWDNPPSRPIPASSPTP